MINILALYRKHNSRKTEDQKKKKKEHVKERNRQIERCIDKYVEENDSKVCQVSVKEYETPIKRHELYIAYKKIPSKERRHFREQRGSYIYTERKHNINHIFTKKKETHHEMEVRNLSLTR